MKTLNVGEAAEMLHIHKDTLYKRAQAGEIPGAKIGKAWVFIDLDLIEFLRTKYKSPTNSGTGMSLYKHFT